MSKIGKKNIIIPKDSSVKIEGSNLTITGPKGTKKLSINDKIFSSQLKESELLQPKRKVIKIYTVKATDTFEKIISNQKIQKRFSKEVFMILNEKKTADLTVGEKIKIIDSQS